MRRDKYPAETSEAFCEGHVAAFVFFGGVPQSILYDNTTLAVARIQGDGTVWLGLLCMFAVQTITPTLHCMRLPACVSEDTLAAVKLNEGRVMAEKFYGFIAEYWTKLTSTGPTPAGPRYW